MTFALSAIRFSLISRLALGSVRYEQDLPFSKRYEPFASQRCHDHHSDSDMSIDCTMILQALKKYSKALAEKLAAKPFFLDNVEDLVYKLEVFEAEGKFFSKGIEDLQGLYLSKGYLSAKEAEDAGGYFMNVLVTYVTMTTSERS